MSANNGSEFLDNIVARNKEKFCRCAYHAPILDRGMLVPGDVTPYRVQRDDGAIMLFAYSCKLEQSRRDVCMGRDQIK